MKRTKTSTTVKLNNNDVDAILCADIHLRTDTPIARTDDYFSAQQKKIHFIRDLQKKHDCPVLIAGDLFNSHKASHRLVGWAIDNLPDKIVCVPGNHELKAHSLELIDDSPLSVLAKAGKIILLLNSNEYVCCNNLTIFGFPFGTELENKKADVALWHHMVWTGKSPWPGCTNPNADEVLEKFDKFKLIITGDNHKSFVVKKDNRLLVNPGSVMRMTTEQESHVPCVFLYSYKLNTVECVPLPIEEDVISREHLENKEVRDRRIEAFIQSLSDQGLIGLDFEHNLDQFIQSNKIKKEVKEIIYKAMENE